MFELTIKEKIKTRMDHLQQLMEGQAHIHRPEYVLDVIDSITKFWSVLDGDDKEYIECARYALEKKHEWSV